MANLLVIVEQQGGRPLPSSLEVLGLGRRVASRLGATLHAAVALPAPPQYGESDLIAHLAEHGADKVVLLIDERIGTDFRWDTHGPALSKVVERLSPAMILFAETSFGRELGPRLAARMGAAFLAQGEIDVDDSCGLSLWENAGEGTRRLELFEGELDFPVVVTVPLGRSSSARGDDEAEVEIVKIDAQPLDFEELSADPDPAPLATVRSSEEQTSRASEALAEALGGSVRSSVDLPFGHLLIQFAPYACPGAVAVAVGPEADTIREAHFALRGPTAATAEALLERLKEPS